MFGSQALETAIGLAVMFFILATAGSAITESISRLMKKRSSDLETTIKEMLTAPAPDNHESRKDRRTRLDSSRPFFDLFKATSVWQAADAASGRSLGFRRKVGASYLSAKGFADAVHELLADDGTQDGILDAVPSLKKRLRALESESRESLTRVKAGLESWFDETMGRAEGAYKRWAALVLFVVGLFLAVVGNASTTDVARNLWQDTATRAAVIEAARNVGDDPADIQTVADATDKLDSLHLPVGWDAAGTDDEKANNGPIDFFMESTPGEAWFTGLGWLLTAVLVMLGAPFWFDLLTRLVALRSTGSKPAPAADDETSATKIVTAAASTETGGAKLAADTDDLAWLRTQLDGGAHRGSTTTRTHEEEAPPPRSDSGGL